MLKFYYLFIMNSLKVGLLRIPILETQILNSCRAPSHRSNKTQLCCERDFKKLFTLKKIKL